MIRRLILILAKRTPRGNMLILCLVVAASLATVGGATLYRSASQSDQPIDSNIAKPTGAPKVKVQPLESKPDNTDSSTVSDEAAPSQSAQPTTAPKPVAPKPVQHSPTVRPTTTATIVAGSLSVGAATSESGICSIPVSASVQTNFSGSVTLHFTALGDSFSKYVTVSPGAVIPVQHSLSFITPGTYTVNVTMSVSAGSFSPAYTGPAISYSGSTTGVATCENY